MTTAITPRMPTLTPPSAIRRLLDRGWGFCQAPEDGWHGRSWVLAMADQTTRLCRARPERDEGLVFARYLDQAADGFFGFMLGRQCASIIADAFTESGHSLSFEHVVVAERDGVIVGMSLAYTSDQHREFSGEPLERAAGRAARPRPPAS